MECCNFVVDNCSKLISSYYCTKANISLSSIIAKLLPLIPRLCYFAPGHSVLNCTRVFLTSFTFLEFFPRSFMFRRAFFTKQSLFDILCCRRQPCAIVARLLLSCQGNTTRSPRTSPITYRSNSPEPTISFRYRYPHYGNSNMSGRT